MCVGTVARVLRVQGDRALVEVEGNEITVDCLDSGLKPGEFVMIHSGFVLGTLSRTRAREMLKLARELGRLSRPQ